MTKVQIPLSELTSAEKNYAIRWGPVTICSLAGIIPADVWEKLLKSGTLGPENESPFRRGP